MSFLYWPTCTLNPRETPANLVPFTRGGGKVLNGMERATRTDKGSWVVELQGISIGGLDYGKKRTWNALRVGLGGRAGLIVVPVRSWDTAPYASGKFERKIMLPHDDGTPFDDGTLYSQGAIDIVMEETATISANIVTLRRVQAADNLAGIRFSYQHALYETGPAIDVDGDLWTLPIFPSIRATIPAGAPLECDEPTCLVHLADDRGMDIAQGKRERQEVSVAFVEAVDYWNDLAGA
ncbi:hypothetical protein [Mesorhizobium sp. IMUNJ 23232]|uniref:hypothetical protein n=1 Tax=Mesorhizobium sp. IMUNJ 23232 TaxID=3376064 RepID=UPI0037AA8990